MAYTFFRRGTSGQQPEGWTPGWNSATWWRRSHHANRIPFVELESDSLITHLSWDEIASTTNVEVLALVVFRFHTSGGIGLRLSGATGAENCYFITGVRSATYDLLLRKYVAGTLSTIGTLKSGTHTVGEPLWLRLQANGTAIKAKYWADGDAEPSSWTVEVTDSDVSGAGLVGLVSGGPFFEHGCQFLAFAAGAIGAVEVPTSPDLEALALGSQPLAAEFVVDVLDEDTETTSEERYRFVAADGAPGVLLDPQGVGVTVEGDVELPEAGSSATVRLNNMPDGGAGPLDHWYDQSLAGQTASIAVSSADHDDTEDFTRILSAQVVGEPDITKEESRVRLVGGSERLLSRPYPVPRYFGQRTWINTITGGGGVVTVTHAAALDLTAFTWHFLFQRTNTGVDVLLFKETAASNRNYRLFVDANGSLAFDYSAGGAVQRIQTANGAIAVGTTYSVVASVLPGVHRYLMVDGEIHDEDSGSSVGTPDTQTANLTLRSVLAGTDTGHYALLGAYVPPEQARSVFASRLTGDEEHMAGLWRLDDETGSTATDYSANGNDGTIGGTEGVNWQYSPTDLGELGLTGRPYPIVLGRPRQTAMDRVDVLRERYRFAEDDITDTDPDFRSEGVSVAESSTADGVVVFGTAQEQPLTVDHDWDTSIATNPNANFYWGEIARDVAGEVSVSIANGDGPNDLHDGVAFLPIHSGLAYAGEAPAAIDVMRRHLTTMGACWWVSEDGLLVPWMVTPPLAPGPVETACVEFFGSTDDDLTGGDHVGLTVFDGLTGLDLDDDITVGYWIKPGHVGWHGEATADGGSTNRLYYAVIYDESGSGTTVSYSGYDAFRLQGVFNSTATSEPELLLDPYEWQYFAFTYDGSATRTKTGYRMPLGGTIKSVGLGTVGAGTGDEASQLLIGGIYGAMQRVSIFNDVLTPAEITTHATATVTGGETNLVAHVPLSEGSGQYVEELVSGKKAWLRRGRWCPRMTLDLSSHGTAEWSDGPRRIRPADEIVVNYDRAWRPLGDAEVAGGVTGDARLEITKTHKELRHFVGGIQVKDARRIELDSTAITKRDASIVAEMAVHRWGQDRMTGTLEKMDRRALSLGLLDEVLISDDRPDWWPRSMRVIGWAISDWEADGPKFKLHLWG